MQRLPAWRRRGLFRAQAACLFLGLGWSALVAGCNDSKNGSVQSGPSSATPTQASETPRAGAEVAPAVPETTLPAAGDSETKNREPDPSPPPAEEKSVGGATADVSSDPKAKEAPVSETPVDQPASGDPHLAALVKLGAVIDYGVGDRVIDVDLDEKPVTDADLEHVAALPDLKILNLSNTQITDEGLKRLTGLTKLKFLYLFNTGISDAGMLSLVELPRLEVLCLDRTRITDVGLKTLEELPRLEKLHVHSLAPVTDAGLESLTKHSRLFELRIGGPGLTEAGVERLKAALPNCEVYFDAGTEAMPE